MHPIKGYLKKLLIVYIISISMVLVYFIIKTFVPQDKELELKSFTKEPTHQVQKPEELTVDINNSKKFLLLPAN